MITRLIMFDSLDWSAYLSILRRKPRVQGTAGPRYLNVYYEVQYVNSCSLPYAHCDLVQFYRRLQ